MRTGRIVHDLHRRGIGRALVNEAARLTRRRSQPVLYIECDSPSVEFWRGMGFTVVPFPSKYHRGAGGTEFYGYRTLSKRNMVKATGKPATIQARLYPENRKYDPMTPPFSVETTTGIEDAGGIIHFKDRLIFFAPPDACHPGVGDCVIEILINGTALCCDKAKYLKGAGVQKCAWGYFVDQVRQP